MVNSKKCILHLAGAANWLSQYCMYNISIFLARARGLA